jgi:hypothetical protein
MAEQKNDAVINVPMPQYLRDWLDKVAEERISSSAAVAREIIADAYKAAKKE